MQVWQCDICQERPAITMTTVLVNGEVYRLCLPCTPFWVSDLFEGQGMPGLEFGFPGVPEQDQTPDGEPVEEDEDEATPDDIGVLEQIEADEGPVAVKANGSRRRKSEPVETVEGDGLHADTPAAADHH